MRTLPSLLATILLAPSVSAFATTIYQFQNQAGTATLGTVTIDSANGVISGLNTTQMINGVNVTFTGPALSQGYNAALNEYQATFSSAGDQLQFNLAGATSLVGYAPADNAFCSVLAFECDYLTNVFQGTPSLTNGPVATFEGNLVPQTGTSVTPEPSSLALLGTGMVALAGFARRRLSR